MAIEKRNSGVATSSSRAIAHSNNAAGTFKPAVHAFQKKPIENNQEGNTQAPDAGRGMAAVSPFQLKPGNGIIQRKVLIGGTPAIDLGGGKAMAGSDVVTVPGDRMSWVNDRYARRYNSVDEFMKHAGGEEVGFGLAKKLGKWYRLPPLESKQFFVLGEYHNGFGYRELMNESNQKGKVLGEGGSNTLMSATPTSALEQNKTKTALKNDKNEVREYSMENPVAKAYYGLTRYRITEKAKSTPKAPDNKEKEAADTWLANYQSAAKGDRDTDATYLPYYKKGTKKVYAEHGTAAEKYDVGKTGLNVLKTFWKAIDGKATRNGYEIDAWLPTKYFIQEYKPGKWDAKAEIQYNTLMAALEKGSKAEADKLAGGAGADMTPFLEKVQDRTGRTGKAAWHSEKSFAYRNIVMYKSVIKASTDGFVMAGMGDFHARDLKEPLAALSTPIQVITLNEFLSAPISTDAIAPMTEQDDKFAEKEGAMAEAKEKYLEEQERIKKEQEDAEKVKKEETPVAETVGV